MRRTSLIYACRNNDVELARELLRQNDDTEPQSTALMARNLALLQAASSGSHDCVRLLIDAAADVNTSDGYGDVLEHAFIYAEIEAEDNILDAFMSVEMLLKAGVSLDYKNSYEWTRLHTAAFRHHAFVVDFLLAHDASRDITDKGATPLHSVCWPDDGKNVERIIQTLASAGFSWEGRDMDRRTPLHEAVAGDGPCVASIKTLLTGRPGRPIRPGRSNTSPYCDRAL
ncbi:MAG: ankyrin repeat domain-containing protein [Armatimonas sp.]